MTEGAMDKVRLGRTDLMVTSICFGTSGLGDMPDTYGYGVDEARDLADDRVEIGRSDGLNKRLGVAIRRTLEHVDGNLEQRMGKANRLRPLFPGRGRVGAGKVLGAHARQRRFEGMAR